MPGRFKKITAVTADVAASDTCEPTHATPRARPVTSASDVQILLQQGEGTTLEYKEGLSDSLARELVALANTRGGKVLLGLRDNGTVSGIGASNSLRARIQDMGRNCDPAIAVIVEPVGRVIVVHVPESDSKPVQCREGFFSRQGAVTQKLSRDEIRNFFRREGGVRFDTSIEPGFRYPDDFDVDKFEAWRRRSGIEPSAPVEDVLVNLGVAERSEGRLVMLNAGVLFFARRPRRFFNQAFITCILFRGTERVDIIDRKDLEGGIVADIEGSMQFIERNTRTAYRIQSLRRQDIPEYPMTALREAIASAVMHRDWFKYGSNVFVEIHADHIDIVSPGRLFGDITTDSLERKCARRNPLIADLLQRVGIIERAGTGIGRMRREARSHGSPEPTFDSNGFFTATFRPLRSMEFEGLEANASPVGQAGLPAQDGARERGHGAHEGAYQGAHERAHDEVHDGAHDGAHDAAINDSERAILEACSEGAVTRDYLVQFGGFSSRSGNFTRAMTRLLVDHLIEMTIPDKPRSRKQRYCATAKGRRALNQK